MHTEGIRFQMHKAVILYKNQCKSEADNTTLLKLDCQLGAWFLIKYKEQKNQIMLFWYSCAVLLECIMHLGLF